MSELAAGRQLPIPDRLNIALLIAAVLVSTALLVIASRASAWSITLFCAVMFSYSANTLFALLHESVHGTLHPNRRVNEWGGRVAAIFFPTALAIQRAYHLTHHRNNRSELERFDYFQPGESVWLKRAQWYAILTGLYWWVSVLGLMLYLLVPSVLRRSALHDSSSRIARQTAAASYTSVLDTVNPRTARAELCLSLFAQFSLFYLFELHLGAWLLCYTAFALQWSSLQYADHAYSPLDPRDGAWNLRVNVVIRSLFLNYHYHLAHHRHPQVSWIHLERFVEADEAQPSYLRTWLSMWRGPRPLPGATE